MKASSLPVSVVIGLVAVGVALGLLSPWALLAFGVFLLVVGAWDLR